MDRVKFDDLVIPLDHFWITKYRVPGVAGFHPRWKYPISLAHPTEDSLEDIIMPTESEVALISAFSEYRLRSWFREHYIDTVIRADILDIDRDGVGVSVGKSEKFGWRYYIPTWRHGPVPSIGNTFRCENVVDLLDRIGGGTEKYPNARYNEWKVSQAELVAAAKEAGLLHA